MSERCPQSESGEHVRGLSTRTCVLCGADDPVGPSLFAPAPPSRERGWHSWHGTRHPDTQYRPCHICGAEPWTVHAPHCSARGWAPAVTSTCNCPADYHDYYVEDGETKVEYHNDWCPKSHRYILRDRPTPAPTSILGPANVVLLAAGASHLLATGGEAGEVQAVPNPEATPAPTLREALDKAKANGADNLTPEPRICDCGHPEGDHGFRPDEACTLCSCINPVWVRPALLKAEMTSEDVRVRCSSCGKSVSNPIRVVGGDGQLYVRAFVQCPECIEAESAPTPAPTQREADVIERLQPWLRHNFGCTIELAGGKCNCGFEAALCASEGQAEPSGLEVPAEWPGDGACGQTQHGYTCTLPASHDGPHEAHRWPEGTLVQSWRASEERK